MSHYLGEERRDDALVQAAELARTFGALAADAESLAALKALRSAVSAGELSAGVLGEVGSVLGRWEWERRGRTLPGSCFRCLWASGSIRRSYGLVIVPLT